MYTLSLRWQRVNELKALAKVAPQEELKITIQDALNFLGWLTIKDGVNTNYPRWGREKECVYVVAMIADKELESRIEA